MCEEGIFRSVLIVLFVFRLELRVEGTHEWSIQRRLCCQQTSLVQ